MKRKIVIICLAILVLITAFGIAQISSSKKTEPDIDMFIGSWKESESRYIYGSLEVCDILTRCKGNPLRPEKKGAVLTDINSLSFASLAANASTTQSKLEEEQFIIYINSGKGIIKSGSRTADLHEGIGVLLPPGIEFTMTNTGNETLTMYIISEPIPEGFRPRMRMVVKDEFDNPISTSISRTNRSNNWLFSRDDGLSTFVAINPIMFEPQSLVQPHLHPEGIEEVWIAIKGEIMIQVGDQRCKLPEGSAYKAPADGITPHTNVNNTDVSKKMMWMMKYPVSNNQTTPNLIM